MSVNEDTRYSRLDVVEKFRHLEENFMRRLNLARKFRKFPIQRELRGGGDCWGRWDMWGVEVGFCHIATVPPHPPFCHIAAEIVPTELVSREISSLHIASNEKRCKNG